MSLFPVRSSDSNDLCIITLDATPTFMQYFSQRTFIHLVTLEPIYLCGHAGACDIIIIS